MTVTQHKKNAKFLGGFSSGKVAFSFAPMGYSVTQQVAPQPLNRRTVTNTEEARQMTYGVKDVTKRFGVGEHTVLAWIRSGELPAINVSRRLGGKPRWRITVESLQAFETLRSATPVKPHTRRRREKATDVVQFY